MSQFTYIDPEHPPAIPRDVAVCPICGEGLYIESIDEWETENGRVTDTGLCLDCESMPGIESDEWDNWFNGHWSMPYVDWLPVTKVVAGWFNEHYRIADEETAVSPELARFFWVDKPAPNVEKYRLTAIRQREILAMKILAATLVLFGFLVLLTGVETWLELGLVFVCPIIGDRLLKKVEAEVRPLGWT